MGSPDPLDNGLVVSSPLDDAQGARGQDLTRYFL
jgi:hypothetical protein